MCKKCGHDNCIGFYLLHPMEFKDIGKIRKKELAENPNRTFDLIDSPSSGETFVKFKELHVLESR